MSLRLYATVSVLAVALTGCQSGPSSLLPPTAAMSAPESAELRADVNPDYRAGDMDIPTAPTSSLQDILAKTSVAPKREKPESREDRLRTPAMEEAAMAYGAQAGLAFATRAINKDLLSRSAELSRVYDFQRLMIQGPNGVMVMPPVISEAVDSWEASDAGKTLRVADTIYEIIEQATFTPVAPMWQTYLITDFEEAKAPPEQLFPRDAEEKVVWQSWVAKGWEKGEEQAEEIFQANLDRLNRDYTGMVRYRALLDENKVSAPVLAEGNLGTTGTGQDMRVNDRAIRITQDPTLQINPRGWDASVTGNNAEGRPEGGAANQTNVAPAARPAERRVEAPARPAPRRTAAPAPKPVDEPTSGGDGRF